MKAECVHYDNGSVELLLSPESDAEREALKIIHETDAVESDHFPINGVTHIGFGRR